MSAPFSASLAFWASSTDSNVNELVKDDVSGWKAPGQSEEEKQDRRGTSGVFNFTVWFSESEI